MGDGRRKKGRSDVTDSADVRLQLRQLTKRVLCSYSVRSGSQARRNQILGERFFFNSMCNSTSVITKGRSPYMVQFRRFFVSKLICNTSSEITSHQMQVTCEPVRAIEPICTSTETITGFTANPHPSFPFLSPSSSGILCSVLYHA